MEVKIFNKTLIPTNMELQELISIVDLLGSTDEESLLLGKSLYKNSLYFKRVRRYKCIIKIWFELFVTPQFAYHTVRNISDINKFVRLILNGIGYNYPVIVKNYAQRNATVIEIRNA